MLTAIFSVSTSIMHLFCIFHYKLKTYMPLSMSTSMVLFAYLLGIFCWQTKLPKTINNKPHWFRLLCKIFTLWMDENCTIPMRCSVKPIIKPKTRWYITQNAWIVPKNKYIKYISCKKGMGNNFGLLVRDWSLLLHIILKFYWLL